MKVLNPACATAWRRNVTRIGLDTLCALFLLPFGKKKQSNIRLGGELKIVSIWQSGLTELFAERGIVPALVVEVSGIGNYAAD